MFSLPLVFGERAGYNALALSCVVWVVAPLPVALVGIQARGLSLRNAEALRNALTNEGLIHIRHHLLESGTIQFV